MRQFSWQVLDDLAFCSERYPRLAELAAQLLFEQQAAQPLAAVDPAEERAGFWASALPAAPTSLTDGGVGGWRRLTPREHWRAVRSAIAWRI